MSDTKGPVTIALDELPDLPTEATSDSPELGSAVLATGAGVRLLRLGSRRGSRLVRWAVAAVGAFAGGKFEAVEGALACQGSRVSPGLL